MLSGENGQFFFADVHPGSFLLTIIAEGFETQRVSGALRPGETYLVPAIRLAVALGGTPIGAPIVGWVANRFGPRWALGVGAASGYAAAIVAVYVLTANAASKSELKTS